MCKNVNRCPSILASDNFQVNEKSCFPQVLQKFDVSWILLKLYALAIEKRDTIWYLVFLYLQTMKATLFNILHYN